jgi:anthranilate synthase component I
VSAPPIRPGEVLPLVRHLQAPADPLDLFSSLTDGGLRPDTLLFESAETTRPQGEKSLLAVRSALRLECRGREVLVQALNANGRSLLEWMAPRLESAAKLERAGAGLRVLYPPPPQGDEDARLLAPSPLDVPRLAALGPAVLGSPGPGMPLVAGVLGYDLLGCFETLPPARGEGSDWPDYELWLPDRMIWLNHRQGTATVAALAHGGPEAESSYHDAAAAVRELSRRLEASPPSGSGVADAHAPGQAAAGAQADVDMSDAQYVELVRTLQRHIVAGDVFQIVASRTFSASCAEPLGAYRRLRRLNPSPYMFFVNGAHGVLFGASPETALRVGGTPPRVEIRPIAGTRRRSADPDVDARIEAELRLDEKEVAEHMMLVDLARNDVARVSEPGTRSVDRLLGVERYSHVMHLVSHVGGRLRAGLDALHAYAATMCMGTLVGAPKLRAAELLRLHELGRRGPYGGAVGYLTADGGLDTSIVIRSAVVKDGVARVRAGAGIVHDSDPQAEANETRSKAAAVLSAIQEAAP